MIYIIYMFYTLYMLAYYYLSYYLVDVCILICGRVKLIDSGTTFE